MIHEAEEFEVSDVARFKEAFEGFRATIEQAGGSDVRLLRHTEAPNRVLGTIRWPDVEACHTFAREHEAEFGSALGPLIVSAGPSQLWEEL